MPKNFSNLSGLRVNRDGKGTAKNFKAHLAELQQQLRDIQEEIRSVTGGGRSQVPTTTKTPFQLTGPDAATAIDKLEVKQGLRTGTKSQVRHDLVTRKELDNKTSISSGGTGFMDLTTNQVVASGNKDFGAISFQRSDYQLTPGTIYPVIDLNGATFWDLSANSAATAQVIIHSFTRPNPDKNQLKVLIWRTYTSNLFLVNNTTISGAASAGKIDTLTAANSAVTNSPTVGTTGPGAFILLYNNFVNKWFVIARNA